MAPRHSIPQILQIHVYKNSLEWWCDFLPFVLHHDKILTFSCDSSILKSIRGRFKSILMENRIALNLKRTQFNRSKFNTSYLSESFRTMFAIHSIHQYISLELNEKPYTFIQAPSIFMYSITRWHCVTISLNIMLTKQRQKEKIKKKTIKSQQ